MNVKFEEGREWRRDTSIPHGDGAFYDLDEFIDAYGGSREAPPEQWVESARNGGSTARE